VERTKPNGRIVGIDILPAQPPKGVSTLQGNFLSPAVQAELKRFLQEQNRGLLQQLSVTNDSLDETINTSIGQDGQITSEIEIDVTSALQESVAVSKNIKKLEKEDGKMVDVIISDMSAPWEQTSGFWKRSLSDPYIRMMNTSGIPFRDHAGSMVSYEWKDKTSG
jgi:21S rRNA (uridine2791-2'-O)-methyltransferase